MVIVMTMVMMMTLTITLIIIIRKMKKISKSYSQKGYKNQDHNFLRITRTPPPQEGTRTAKGLKKTLNSIFILHPKALCPLSRFLTYIIPINPL